MLLPRYSLPPSSTTVQGSADPSSADLGPPLPDPVDLARHRLQTIDDPALRADLDGMLEDEPLAFLSFAASTIALHGMATPTLVRDLIRSGYHEGAALAAALWWLCGLRPPDALLDVDLPLWLTSLDQARVRVVRRRREGVDRRIVSYLLEVELAGGRVGTLHIQVDHVEPEAVVHAFAADQSLADTMSLFRAAARWRQESDLGASPASPFRAIGVARAIMSLAGVVRSTDGADVPINLQSPWPGIRTLLIFFLIDIDVE